MGYFVRLALKAVSATAQRGIAERPQASIQAGKRHGIWNRTVQWDTGVIFRAPGVRRLKSLIHSLKRGLVLFAR